MMTATPPPQSPEVIPTTASYQLSTCGASISSPCDSSLVEWDPYASTSDEGYAKLEGTVDDKPFICIIKTLMCVIGREAGNDSDKSYSGYHCKEMARQERGAVSVFIYRPSGLESFEELPWHPFDFTRIAFGSYKTLSRTHMSLSWSTEKQVWTVLCLSGNGIYVNDENKLGLGVASNLKNGDVIGAVNNTIKLAFRVAV
eukprot:Blabericola_migrator_1__13582@NODE_99_length_14373_cov_95_300643_g89_i0_p8_GENE_NODE_99_length_14373_cov_95_300643_g89_i0NODE_99_length_14373_cov_95_300643_g89_i0_p8_ORF_typecomplete_len200_score28_52FHA/PF00498_26/71FHA/PF00498_26/3_8e07FHA_2/PF17913_1/1_2e03FHA_2/PF17913_1/0_00096YopYscD_cpl/PF16697_5/1_5e03YopYscD_cpl/PF16697_5/0_058_NODE_99_length_14373_cov_95_300643_g89_i01133811937